MNTTRVELGKIADAAFGLWVIPFWPPAGMVIAAWAAGWLFPMIVLAILIWGWPYVWFRWLIGGADVRN